MDVMLLGGLPRSDRARKTLRALEEGSIGVEEAERTLFEEEALAIGAQIGAGLRLVTDPALSWHDMLRPYAESWRGVTVDGLARWFDNNFFYRIPVFYSKPEPSKTILAPRARTLASKLPRGYSLKVTSIGPLTMVKLSRVEPSVSVDEVLAEAARIIGDEARRALDAGAVLVELAEPWLGDIDASVEDAEKLMSLLDHMPLDRIVLTIYYQPPRDDVWARLDRVKILHLDYADNPKKALKCLERMCPETLVLGVLDARNIYLEPRSRVEEAIREARRRCRESKIILSTSSPLDLIPYVNAIQKMRHLVELAEVLNEL